MFRIAAPVELKDGLGIIIGQDRRRGTGVIGASWAAYFLAKGFDVAATDPADGAERRLRTLVDGFWPALECVGLAASPRFTADVFFRPSGDLRFIQWRRRPMPLSGHSLVSPG